MVRTSSLLVLIAALAACDVGALPGAGGDAGPNPNGPDAAPGQRHHPVGFADAAMHGPALKLRGAPGAEDCRTCHGADLTGTASAPSCDACHDPANPTKWRTTCTFCHGGTNDQTGAPPRNLDGTTTAGVFPAHTKHVATAMTSTIDCIECHVKAQDVLSAGHVFDDTPQGADVDFGGGRSPQSTWTKGTGCATNYCHGSGRGDDGTVALNAPAMTCASCHPGQSSGAAAFATMSGMHATHMNVAGVTCAECHNGTTTNGTTIANKALHINGVRDINLAASTATSYDPSTTTCTGTCHGFTHSGFDWAGTTGGRYHPVGFADPTMHGPEMELQRQDCRACHGATLTGGSAGQPSCDGCHQSNWRTNCLYCHGGTANSTGAPGRDPGAPPGTVSARFLAHTKHVQATITNSYDCVQCHIKPTDVLSLNHAFDSTPGAGETSFSAGLSPAGVFAASTGTCTNLYCHGNGRGDNGTYKDGNAPPTCGSCHAGMSSGSTAWSLMSGDHRKHLSMSGVTCGDCHNAVTTNGTTIANKALHINKQRDTKFTSTIVYNPATKRCTGSCHGAGHNETW